jgi:hypothetical protein
MCIIKGVRVEDLVEKQNKTTLFNVTVIKGVIKAAIEKRQQS